MNKLIAILYILIQSGLLIMICYLIGSLIFNDVARTVWIPTSIAIIFIIIQMFAMRKLNKK
jgi:hypothetical protein